MVSIYDNIRRLEQLANYGENVATLAAEIKANIQGRAQEALDIVGTAGAFARELQEIKELAAAEEERVNRLNIMLSSVITAEARRMLGGAG